MLENSCDWLSVHRGTIPLILSLPHTGIVIPAEFEPHFVSSWLARKDCDWWIEKLYDFASHLGATVIRTEISRSVIDVNRDPSGQSLYPGQATTALCPVTTFDGEPLYKPDREPDEAEIARRRRLWFDPYHDAVAAEIARLRTRHPSIVLYDCHSIRSQIPRLFDGLLPHCNIGTNSGHSCAPALQAGIETLCEGSRFSHVSNGRFKGGYITRHYGKPDRGVHVVQLELACRGYMQETPGPVTPSDWPQPYNQPFAAPMSELLRAILRSCLNFAHEKKTSD